MERYDYYKAVKEDAIDAIIESVNWNGVEYLEDEDRIYNDLWVDDGVTGNGSGSYTFSSWEAEENVCHNLDLLGEALSEFGCDGMKMNGGEWADVTIRCYVLGQVVGDAIEEARELIEESEGK